MDKSWIGLRNRLCREYVDGVASFIEVAKRHLDDEGKTRCPCRNCLNAYWHPIEVVNKHIYRYGFSRLYVNWVFHGEEHVASTSNIGPNNSSVGEQETEDIDECYDDDMLDILNDVYHSYDDDDMENVEPHNYNEEIGNDNHGFDNLFVEAGRKLYPTCKLSTLTFVVKLMHVKVLNHWSNKSLDMLLQLLGDVFPEGANIPKDTYSVKKMLRSLGLGHEKIHACKNDCVLFWKENADLDRCPECGEPRYKVKNIPNKVLRYFPLKPRLQRLFMSRHTSRDMRWHSEKRVDDGVLRHPADGEAWKEFNRMYPSFSNDARNVYMGLASDGFNPFGNISSSYSMWPVILTPYNLPPWKCMKQPYLMMSLLIPGPKSPGREIDVYLRPLVEELKELWNGVPTYDYLTGKIFQMHAVVLWTINDFPAYGILSGWSTKGYMACPVCNKETSSLKLRSKICYMGHRRYLPSDHRWRRSRLHDGHYETRSAPKELSGDDIVRQLKCVETIKLGKHPRLKRKRTAAELNWTKKSIFFELEYWSSLKIRHTLDVMHIERNICDNIVGTLLDIDNKTKDNFKARKDLEDMKIRKELHLAKCGDQRYVKPHAKYTLTRQERVEFCRFLTSIQYPDGYAANLSKSVNVKDGKITGLKSHDCHVLLQRLLPIGIQKFLPRDICNPLVELSSFFQQLCAKSISINDLMKLEDGIAFILCKLERIFPPAFFDIMVHLAVHLPYEARLTGPVGFRWMYPIERVLGTYKGYVKNKARPEGSIAEAYNANEALTFCSMYFRDIETKFNRPERNVDVGNEIGGISVFNQRAKSYGASHLKLLEEEEIKKIHWYILNNCEEIADYLDEHMVELEKESSDNLFQRQQEKFPAWFQNRMEILRFQGATDATVDLYSLASMPDRRVNIYPACIVNGVRFIVKERDDRLITQNSGVMVRGVHEEDEIDFYGVLESIIKVHYKFDKSAFVFKCKWFDTNPKKKWVQKDYHLTSINICHQWYTADPYILASQARQVFYIDDPKLGINWKVVQNAQHRNLWDIPEKMEEEDEVEISSLDAYQEDESSDVAWRVDNELNELHLQRVDVEPDIVEYVEPNFTTLDDDDFIDDGSENEMSGDNSVFDSEDHVLTDKDDSD